MEAARAKGLSARHARSPGARRRTQSRAWRAASRQIAALADPIGTTIAQWTRPNGLDIARVRVPLGVIGIIYESRPNVTCDAGALCLKSGNAAILRGGSESAHSSRAIHACLVDGLDAPPACRPQHPAGADHRSRRRRLHAVVDDGLHRRGRAARRQEPGRARAAGSARAGHRASRRRAATCTSIAMPTSAWRAPSS